MGGVIVYGDPHGEWRPLLQACARCRPDAVVILGDCGLEVPLREQVKPVLDAGTGVFWIPGNHDCDTPEAYDRLWGDHPDGDLHGRQRQVADLAVAGLGGVFKERVWYPRAGVAAPVHATRRDCLRGIARTDRWRGELPLRLRDAIFPEDVESMHGTRADVLVTHEAPSCHRHGFVGIDVAAALCGARLVVHGHHHEGYVGTLPGGVQVIGLGRAQVLRLGPEHLA